MSRINHAFNVLSDCAKRREYDRLLFPDKCHTQELIISTATAINMQSAGERWTPALQEYAGLNRGQTNDDRRKHERVKLSIPVYVTGNERASGEWHEMTYTIDVSRIGALLCLRKRVRHRMLLHLALPLPMRLRCHRHCEPSYSVYAIVRRIEPPQNNARVVAVEFVGEHPPEGYIDKPWATYLTRWRGAERRRAPRQDISEAIYIEYLDDKLHLISQETAIAENASSRGMRVIVNSTPPDFEAVKIVSPGRNFESLAVATNRFIGKDRLERICLQFVHQN
jgi:hypothetical protein